MAESITHITWASDTVEQLVTQVNLMINAISNRVVTANNNANGAVTVGNTFVYGIAGANTVVVWNAIRGGNVQTSNTLWLGSNLHANGFAYLAGNSTVNTTINSTAHAVTNSTGNVNITSSTITLANSTVSFAISKPTAAQAADGTYYLNANGSFSSVSSNVANVTTTGTSAQLISSYDISAIRSAELLVSVKDNVANGYQLSKLMVLWDGSDALLSEYGVIQSNGSQGTFSANANSTFVRVYITPVSANATVVHMLRQTLPI